MCVVMFKRGVRAVSHSLFAYFRDRRLIMKGLKEKRERYFLMMKRQHIIHN